MIQKENTPFTIQEVSDALPILIGIHGSGFRFRSELAGCLSVGEPPSRQGRSAPALRPVGAEHAQQAHVVLDRRYAGLRTIADDRLDGFDVAIALRTLAKHNRRTFRPIDVAGCEERRRNAVQGDAFKLQGSHAAAEPSEARLGGLEVGHILNATVSLLSLNQLFPSSESPFHDDVLPPSILR